MNDINDITVETLVTLRKIIEFRSYLSSELIGLRAGLHGIYTVGGEAHVISNTMENASYTVPGKLLKLEEVLNNFRKNQNKAVRNHISTIAKANDQFMKIVEVCNTRIAYNPQKYREMPIPYNKYEFYDIANIETMVRNMHNGVLQIHSMFNDIDTLLGIMNHNGARSVEAQKFLDTHSASLDGFRAKPAKSVDDLIDLEVMRVELKRFMKNKIKVQNPQFDDFKDYIDSMYNFTANEFSIIIKDSIGLSDKIDSTITKVYKAKKKRFKYELGQGNDTPDKRHDIIDVFDAITIRLSSAYQAYLDLMALLTTSIGEVYKDSKNILTMKAYVMARG